MRIWGAVQFTLFGVGLLSPYRPLIFFSFLYVFYKTFRILIIALRTEIPLVKFALLSDCPIKKLKSSWFLCRKKFVQFMSSALVLPNGWTQRPFFAQKSTFIGHAIRIPQSTTYLILLEFFHHFLKFHHFFTGNTVRKHRTFEGAQGQASPPRRRRIKVGGWLILKRCLLEAG